MFLLTLFYLTLNKAFSLERGKKKLRHHYLGQGELWIGKSPLFFNGCITDRFTPICNTFVQLGWYE